jgi:hypothetical protein
MSREPTDLGLESDEDSFATDEVTGLSSYTFSDRIKERMKDLGLTGYADRPRLSEEHDGIFPDLESGDYFNGRLPVVVRRLSLDQISALYSLYTAWFAYLTFQTNMIAAERSEAFTQKEFVWSHVRKQYKYYTDMGDDKIRKRSDQQMSDEARCDYRFVKANSRYTELNTLYKSMLDTMEVAKKDMEMVSREVTIVQTKLEAEAQAAGIKGRPWRGKGTYEAEDQTRPKRPRVTKPRAR